MKSTAIITVSILTLALISPFDNSSLENMCEECTESICEQCLSNEEKTTLVEDNTSLRYRVSNDQEYCDGLTRESIARSTQHEKNLLFLTVGEINQVLVQQNSVELTVKHDNVCIRGLDLTNYYQFDAYVEHANRMLRVNNNRMVSNRKLLFFATNNQNDWKPKFYTPVYISNQDQSFLYVGFRSGIIGSYLAYYSYGAEQRETEVTHFSGSTHYIRIPMSDLIPMRQFEFNIDVVDHNQKPKTIFKNHITIIL